LGLGLQGVHALGLEGERLAGVHDAVAFIERLRQTKDLSTLPVGRNVVVIGGGNTAIDIATQTKRLGAETVTIVCRRGPEQMSASPAEQEWAKSNGVAIRHWARPVAIEGIDGHVRSVTFERTRLDREGRLEGTGERFTLPADQLFKAIGQKLVPSAFNGTAELLDVENGKIVVDAERRTTLDRVWAGGDCIGSSVDLTVAAVEDGKLAAASINRYLMGG
jgi:glutamate synthase (NADPH/NADH) small chain